MSLIEKVGSLRPELIQELIQFYEQVPFFPLELRQQFSQHVEALFCHENYPDPEASPVEAQTFVSGILQPLEEHLSSQNLNILTKLKLTTALQQLKELDVTTIYRRIEACITFEMDLLRRSESGGGGFLEQDILAESLSQSKKSIDRVGELLKLMIQEQDAFEIHLSDKQTLEEHLTKVQAVPAPNDQTRNFEKSVKEELTKKTAALEANLQRMLGLRKEFWDGIRGNVHLISELQNQIFQDKLYIWKLQQQKGANGLHALNPVPMDKVQAYLEALAELIWRTRQQVLETERLKARNTVFNEEAVPGVLEELVNILNRLLNESFLIEDQPQQVMKKGNKFPIAPKVVLLVGNLNIQLSGPLVTAQIIREGQARHLSVTEKVEEAMPLLNGCTTMDLNPQTRRLTAKFPSLQLKEIKRETKSGSGSAATSVMEEKLCMLFQSHLQVGDLKFRVRTLSLPVVVTSHGSQDPTAEATIMWDNAFGQLGRVPFVVPNRVPWNELSPVISAKFLHLTGRALTDDNLRYLKGKALRGATHSDTITWGEFAKDNLPGTNFTFWQWTHHALKNIEKKETSLKEVWKEGHLVGFVEREVAEQMLQVCLPGTFILRFSDSKPGAITISFLGDDGKVYCIAPMDENDLKQKRLANTIRDLDKLKILYPSTLKDDAFGKHYSAPEVPASGKPYVPLLPSIPDDGRKRSFSSGSCSMQGQWGPSIITTPSSQPGSPFPGMAMDQGYQFAPSPGQSPYSIPPSVLEQMNPMAMEVPDQVVEDFMTLLDHSDLLQVGDMNDGTPTSNGNNNCQTSDSGGTWSNFVQL